MNVVMSPAVAVQLFNIVALSAVFTPCTTQIAVIRPLLYTARLDGTGTFHCSVTGSNRISWYVDGTPSRYPSIRNRGILTSSVTSINATWIQSNLTVPGIRENDESSINCIAFAFVDGKQLSGISETAVFRVQVPPLSPTNLTLEVSGDCLTLRWNPPSDTILINDSIVSMYTVYVNISQTGIETHSNTTMRQYTVENPCSDVKFKVTAWNDIGEGTATTYLIYRHNSAEPELIVLKTEKVSVTFAASGEPIVQLLLQITNSCFHRLKVDLQVFLVNTRSVCSDLTHQQGPLMLEPTIVNSTVILDIPHLPNNCQITATVQSQSVSNSSSTITFATYGVQDVEISESSRPNSICATCIFAEGTAVRGCYVHLLQEHSSLTTNISGIRIAIGRGSDILNATSCINKLENKSDRYHVVVYDIEADGTVDWHNRALSVIVSLNFTSSPGHLSTDAPSDFVSTVIPSNFTMQEELTVFATVGATGGGALLLVLIIGIFCALLIRKFHSTTDESKNIKQSNRDDAGDIEMKRNEIYGQLPQQQVARNPAYSWWYPS